MALPTSGQLTFSQIYAEVYGSHSSQQCSMFAMATSAGKSTTNASVSNFYGYSNQTLQFNSSYSFYWEWNEFGSGQAQYAYITITPDATFATTQPTNFTRVDNQTSNYAYYYPSTSNSGPIPRLGTSTLTASGYSCTGDCTVSLEQNGNQMTSLCSFTTCLIGDTLITMSDKKKKKIADIKSGDKVLAYDYDEKKDVESTVIEIRTTLHDNLAQIKYDGKEIICTTDHPFYIKNKGWSSLHAGKTNRYYPNIPNHCQRMEMGDEILTCYGFKPIESIIFIEQSVPTWNISKAEYNTYHANDLLTLIELR